MEMKLLNNVEENNFITGDNHQKHTIKKYEFRNIDKVLESQIASAIEENGIYTPTEEKSEHFVDFTDHFIRLFEENQKILQTLADVQKQIPALEDQQSMILEEAKNNAYQQGCLDGEKKMEESLRGEIDAQKDKMVLSIQSLEEKAKKLQNQIEEIAQDLNTIALDLAKEVILKEVQENHQEIALLIANELLQPLKGSTDIIIKANPADLAFLQEKIPADSKVTFEADLLVAKGGVMITSNLGNFDGSILSRYKNLKRHILEEKGL